MKMKSATVLVGVALGACLALMPCARAASTSAALDVAINKPGAKINPSMWGIFFEDINQGADGGIYAELVKNRSFEFPEAMMGWQTVAQGVGTLEVCTNDSPSVANPHYVRLTKDTPEGAFGIENEGFRGIGVKAGSRYDFSVMARIVRGGPVKISVALISAKGRVLDQARCQEVTMGWQKTTCTLHPAATDPKARLRVSVLGEGVVDLDMVSLFPHATWKGRPNGLRADVVQLLADLKPGFVRFPGGCIVEGRDLANRYQWKNTLGDPSERKLIINRWNTEFKHRPAPDYFQSFGLGFMEYFQLCEDIGAEPLPILNCGMACQFNTGELVPMDRLDPYIQDALDLIEFANGPVTSPWGAQRAALGHPAPFNMKVLGVGNEQWGPQYVERLARFTSAIKERYPGIQLVCSAGPDPEGEKFDFLWPKLRELKADLVDEHYYRPPDWFLKNDHRYDNYDRNGPKIFAGEYAAQSVATCSPENRNNLQCALAEAAFMTGLERNADVVRMASYAPLFGHTEAWQWKPNLIWFNNLSAFGTPNYYVQKLFANHRGDTTLPVVLRANDAVFDKLRVSAVRDTEAREVILKVVNTGVQSCEIQVNLTGATRYEHKAQTWTLTSSSLQNENSLEKPMLIAPVEEKVKIQAPTFKYTFPSYSLTVLRLRVR